MLSTSIGSKAQSRSEFTLPDGFPRFTDTGNPELDALEYDKLKKEWYRQNGQQISDTEYGFVNFGDPSKTAGCELRFVVPTTLNQPTELMGTWSLQGIQVIGGKDEKERLEAQEAIWHDLQMGSILELDVDHGTFLANTNVKSSYWNYDHQTKQLVVSSYSECVCYVWDVMFEFISVTEKELKVIMNDSDEGSSIRYQLQYSKG